MSSAAAAASPAAADEPTPPTTPTPSTTVFRLRVFQELEAVHAGHGVAHQDYGQYHRYCTARLDRLRHVRAVRPALVHNHKYAAAAASAAAAAAAAAAADTAEGSSTALTTAPATTGIGGGGGKQTRRKHAYCRREEEIPSAANADDAAIIIGHENVLWNLLFQAERAWAQACELQQQKSTNTSTKSSSGNKKKKNPSRSYVLRRLKKAAQWAARLEGAVGGNSSCVSEETAAECRSYAAWMKGSADLERKDYPAAFRAYKLSMTVLLQLADGVATGSSATDTASTTTTVAASASTPDALALGDIWTTRAETVLRPLVRFCGYEARDQIDPSELQETNAAAKTGAGGGAAAGGTDGSILLAFRGRRIALDSYKQIAVLYLKMEGALLDQSGADHGLQLLTDLDDAIRLVQVESGHYAALPAGPAVTAKREELQALGGYFQFQKLSAWRRQQEGRLKDLTDGDDAEEAGGGSHDAEIVHVYDTLLQNAEAIANALGGSDDSGAGDLEDDPFWLEAQAHVIRIRAFRCYYLARLYESALLNGTPAQVLALLRQSGKLCKRAQEEVAACDDETMERSDEYLEGLGDLASKIASMSCRAEAARFLSSVDGGGGGANSNRTTRPLWMRLNDLDAGTCLADNPPLPIPMPCKPSFFDLAWQHVDSDIAAPLDVIQEHIKANEPKKKGFISSWFGS